MPNISVKTNASVSPESASVIKSALGRAIALIPGKSETWLMCSVEGSISMNFQGTDEPCAMVNVEILGDTSRSNCEKLCYEITDILNKNLSVNKDRIYVKFEPCDKWGWNGGLF